MTYLSGLLVKLPDDLLGWIKKGKPAVPALRFIEEKSNMQQVGRSGKNMQKHRQLCGRNFIPGLCCIRNSIGIGLKT